MARDLCEGIIWRNTLVLVKITSKSSQLEQLVWSCCWPLAQFCTNREQKQPTLSLEILQGADLADTDTPAGQSTQINAHNNQRTFSCCFSSPCPGRRWCPLLLAWTWSHTGVLHDDTRATYKCPVKQIKHKWKGDVPPPRCWHTGGCQPHNTI